MPTPRTIISSIDTTTGTSEEKSFTLEGSSLLPPLPSNGIQAEMFAHPSKASLKASKKGGRSIIWKYFQVYKEAKFKAWTFCTLCSKQVNYTDTMSTGILLRHLQKCHKQEYGSVVEKDLERKAKDKSTSGSQSKISGFIAYFPSFEKAYTNWVIQTYQPLSSCENPAFVPCAKVWTWRLPLLGVRDYEFY